MTPGSAFIAIWHAIEPSADKDFHHWHSRQHMPERVRTPGFTRGRRFVPAPGHCGPYFVLYEGENLDVFSSPIYLKPGSDPEWDKRIAQNFRDYMRGVFECVATAGEGSAGALAAIKVDPGQAGIPADRAKAICADLAGRHGVIRAHYGVLNITVSNAKGGAVLPELPPAGLLVIEAMSVADAEKARDDAVAAFGGAAAGVTAKPAGIFLMAQALPV